MSGVLDFSGYGGLCSYANFICFLKTISKDKNIKFQLKVSSAYQREPGAGNEINPRKGGEYFIKDFTSFVTVIALLLTISFQDILTYF